MNKLKKNLILQIVYRLITVLTPLITSPYLSRTLGPEKIGVFSGTYAYANYFILFSMLGVEFYGNRSIAVIAYDKNLRKENFWGIYSIQFFAALISVFIYLVTYKFIFDPNRYTVCLLQSMWIVAAGLDINWYFWGKSEFVITVTRNIVIKIISIVCILLFVNKPEDINIYVFIMSFSTLFCQGVLWIYLFKDIGFKPQNWQTIKANIKPIIILFIPVLAMSVFHIMDKTMVDILSDNANGGYYYNVDRLVNIPLGIITGLGTVMLPQVASYYYVGDFKRVNEVLLKSAELTMSISCAVAFGLGGIAEIFVPVFFGERYLPCVLMIIVFMPIIIIKSISDFIRQQYLIPSKQDKLYVIAMVFGAVVNIVSNYFFITRMGALGAVIGTFIAESVVFVIEYTGSKSKINFGDIFKPHIFYLIDGFFMFLIVFAISRNIKIYNVANLVFLIVIGGFFYFSFCIPYWIIQRKSIFNKYVFKILDLLKGEKNV